jgi:uncharacterized protein YjiS (DUF1127 family)
MFTTFNAALGRLRKWQERQRVLNELYSMDDRMLADIGLRRGDIPFVRLDKPASPVNQPSRNAANQPHQRAA